MLEWEKKRFKKMFPNIYREIEGDVLPSILDHLERCESLEQAYEVIDYFLRIGEITEEHAEFLKNSRITEGIIGSRKAGEYVKRGLR